MSERPSLRAAIDAACKACLYDPGAGGKWREQVALCSSASCPLHHVRPVPPYCVRDGSIVPEGLALVRLRVAA